MVRWSGEVQVNVSGKSGELQIQSELDIGGRETCNIFLAISESLKRREAPLSLVA